MTRIMLVRHGLTFWNSMGKLQGNSEVHLSPDGLHQARLLAAHCPFFSANAIYSSPLERAQTTALILASRFNLRVETVNELREINFGDWEGKVLRELAQSDPDNFEKFFKHPEELKLPHAETFLQVQERAMGALNKICDAHRDEKDSHVIIVSHGAVNRVILCALLEIPIRKMWAISQFNTAVNIFREDDGHFTVDLVNSTAHLA